MKHNMNNVHLYHKVEITLQRDGGEFLCEE